MELHTWNVVAAVAVAVAAIWGLLQPVVLRLFHSLWLKTFGIRGAQLNRIEAELMSNGGRSLKDLIYTVKENLEESKALQLAYFATREEAVWIADVHGDLKWASPALQRLTGRTGGELSGKGWINAFPQRIRDSVQHEWYDNAVEGHRNFEHAARIKVGENELHVLITGIRMTNTVGKMIGYFGAMKVYDEIE